MEKHALSDVDLTVYDGVNDVCGRIGHGGGGGKAGGRHREEDERFNERSMGVPKKEAQGEGELIAIRARDTDYRTNRFPATHFPFRFLGLIILPITLIGNSLPPTCHLSLSSILRHVNRRSPHGKWCGVKLSSVGSKYRLLGYRGLR